MKLLVTTSRSLLLFDVNTGECQPIHRGAGLYYGIAATPRHYLVAARQRMVSSTDAVDTEKGQIFIFDQRLQWVGSWQPPFALRDMHEIKWHRRHLWVTCSYDNMLAIRSPDGRWEQWYPLGEPATDLRDINHFNSLFLHGNRLWVLAHNRGPSEILQFDINMRRLHQRMPLGRQAHNLWQIDNQWHTCSSAEGGITNQSGGFIATGGFPRGIARLKKGWAVGISQLAERQQRDFSEGQIVIYDQQWQELQRHTLQGEGLILDILPYPQGLGAVIGRIAAFFR
jgi:hypothetical protein